MLCLNVTFGFNARKGWLKKIMLNIRSFVRNQDELTWIEILNAAYKEYEGLCRVLTVKEMYELEKDPNFDLGMRYIAELDEKPVGILLANVDTSGVEKKGYIRSFAVIPRFRGRGVEEKLLEAAIKELKGRGIKLIMAWTEARRIEQIRVFKKLGFRFDYRTFDMETDLSKIPSDAGKNTDVTVRKFRKELKEDIKMLNWLVNECFKEFNSFKPITIEETCKSLKNPKLSKQEFLFATLDGKDVGFIGISIDEEYNKRRKARYGKINSIGVLKPYRRKGIGTRLMIDALSALKAKGMARATLDTEDCNPTETMKFFQAVGFRIVQEYLTYEKRILTS